MTLSPLTFRVVVAVLLMLAIGGVFLFWSRTGEPPAGLEEAATNQFYLKQFTLTGYDGGGQPNVRLEAERLEQSSLSGDSTITAPRFRLTDEKGGVWRLEAESGEMDEAMIHAALAGDVTLVFEDNPHAVMKTPRLDAELKARIVSTDAGVRVIQGNNHIESVSMRADLARDRISLSDSVRGVYVP